MDKPHRDADKRLKTMERRLNQIYSRAAQENWAAWQEYLKSLEPEAAALLTEIAAAPDAKTAAAAKKKYARFLRDRTLMDEHFKAVTEATVQQLSHTNEMAQAYINGQLPPVYTSAINFTNSQIGKEAVNYVWSILDANTVAFLATQDKTLLPLKKVNGKKDIRWNTKKLNAEVLQGILQGESMDKIAARFQKVQDMNQAAAIRNARTAVTSAENKGRIDGMKQAKKQGIIIKKEWISTSDERTRDWHRELDGKTAPVDGYFENSIGKIRYPGDPEANGANVYNCRCTLAAKVEGFKPARG